MIDNLTCLLTYVGGAGGIQTLSERPTGFLQCFDTVGLVTCKNRPRNDLQCVEWDVKSLHYYC